MGIYDEMDVAEKEINETLPVEASEEKEEKEDYLNQYSPQQETQNKSWSQPVMFNNEQDGNLIKNLLTVDWERVEHIVRGHKPKVDSKGNEYFIQIKDHYLNDYGVNNILHFLSFYLSKEIFLARYSQKKVELIMKQFSQQFTDFFYDNIEEFGLDTPEKKKMSNMFVRAIIDLVDSAYSKAVEGKLSEMVFKQFQVLQNQPLESNYNPMNPQPKGKKSVFARVFG